MKTLRAVIEPMDGYAIVTLKRLSTRQRNWISVWRAKMLPARALIVKHEWERNGSTEGLV